MVSDWRGFLFVCVLGMGYTILLWHSLILPYNHFEKFCFHNTKGTFSLYKGNERLSIYYARLRNICCDLNNDLYVNHIKPAPTCECGLDVGNAEHYFFKCVRFVEQRLTLVRATRPFPPTKYKQTSVWSSK